METARPGRGGAGGDGAKVERIETTLDSNANTAHAQARPYVSRYGTRHSEAIFRHWNPRVIEALGIRRVEPDGSDQ